MPSCARRRVGYLLLGERLAPLLLLGETCLGFGGGFARIVELLVSRLGHNVLALAALLQLFQLFTTQGGECIVQ